MKTITMRAIAALLSLAVAWTPRAGGQENRPGRAGTTQRPSAFREVGKDAGLLPHVAGIWGHGAGWGDVDGDRWIDLYVGTFHYARSKPNLFFRNVKGKFRLDDQEALRISTRATGVVFADLDNDGDLDLYVGSMPKRKGGNYRQHVAGCSLFRNDGKGRFTNISEGSGACPRAFGGRSAAVLDYDGDGLPDLHASVPVIYRTIGVKDGLPRFRAQFLGGRYTAPGPSGDYDNDGRLDLVLPAFRGRLMLLHNETPAGGWLHVRVEGGGKVNRMGIGARIKVYPAGRLGQASALLGWREIGTGHGYASGQPALAHFGPGKVPRVDLEVILPHGKGTLTRRNLQANQRITIQVERTK